MNVPAVVTDKYIKALEGKQVLQALFTTYTFKMDFFESEIMWILTAKDMDKFSPDSDVRRKQLAFYYQQNKLPVTLYFDRKVNNWDKENEQVGNQLIEYLLVPINSGNHAFHPKISLLLLEDIKTKQKSVLYVNGSNNLTYNGWWENVECVNMQLIDRNKISQSLFNDYTDTLNYLVVEREKIAGPDEKIKDFFDVLPKELDNTIKEKYFSTLYSKKQSFSEFIKNSINLSDYSILEVISPYFAEDSDKVVELLQAISKPEFRTKLYLPRNAGGELLCTEELFQTVIDNPYISWGSFQPELEKKLLLKTTIKVDDEEQVNSRTVHAKVFHWHNSETKKSAFFMGSINLSYKAFEANEEAGKLFFINNSEELLQEIKIEEPRFEKEIELLNKDDEIEDKINYFVGVSLVYDWKDKILRIFLCDSTVELNNFKMLLDEKELLIESDIINEAVLIEKALEKSPFITLLYNNEKKKIFVNQKNFTYKRLDLGSLTVKEILDIYAKFGIGKNSDEYIKLAIQRALSSKGIESDNDFIHTDTREINFFSEYSEIFYGLRQLKNFLSEPTTNTDYFLNVNSKAMDSIPILVEETINDEKMDLVSKYITLLYVKQIYINYKLSTEFIDQKINMLKKNNSIEFEKNTLFVKWFENAFFMEFSKGSENDQ